MVGFSCTFCETPSLADKPRQPSPAENAGAVIDKLIEGGPLPSPDIAVDINSTLCADRYKSTQPATPSARDLGEEYAAEQGFPLKSEHDKPERYDTLMRYEIRSYVSEAWDAGHAAATAQMGSPPVDFEYLIGQLLSCVERAEGIIDGGPVTREAEKHVHAWRQRK